jgi:hypothetical protein
MELPIDPKRVNRIPDPLPAPTVCPNCGGRVYLVHNSEVYNGQAYGVWPYVYACEDKVCGSYVGLHPNSYVPLGTLANRPLRNARRLAKEAFNPLWQGFKYAERRRMARTEAYTWLAQRLGIPKSQCHIAWFDEPTCYAVVAHCKEKTCAP